MRRLLAVAVAIAVPLAGCASGDEVGAAAGSTAAARDEASPPAPASPAAASPSPAAPTPTPTPSPSPTAAEESEEEPLSDAELAALGANELGRVLVGEWHRIGDTDGEYRTSRETFRTQLQALYDRGYRPVTQAEFVAGTFPIPAGTSPVLLTFDDSTRDQVDLDEDGRPKPDTAVGILEDFAADKPDWRATAVFGFNFPQPFGDAGFADELRWLADNGYEFSNHSHGHVSFRSMSSAEVEVNLAQNQALLHEVLPDVEVPSLTLPLGIHAEDPAVELAGSADGVSYRHDLVYLVGAYPTRSPHDREFDPAAIQRVPAHAVVGSGPEWFWDRLDGLDEPGQRFVSDGVPDIVSYPAELADQAAVDTATFEVREYG